MTDAGLNKPTADALAPITFPKEKNGWGTYNKFSLEDLYGRVPVEIPKAHTNRVIVQFAALPSTTKGGIIIIDDERKNIHYGQPIGKIISIGEQAFSTWHWQGQETPKVGEYWYIGRACGGEITGCTIDGEEVQMQHIQGELLMSKVQDPRNFKFTT